jgi:hypothetical protein
LKRSVRLSLYRVESEEASRLCHAGSAPPFLLASSK